MTEFWSNGTHGIDHAPMLQVDFENASTCKGGVVASTESTERIQSNRSALQPPVEEELHLFQPMPG